MKLTIVSDLHIEHHDNSFLDTLSGEILIVAGDTSNNPKTSAKQIARAAKNFEQVLVIPGNHEHYTNIGSGAISIKECNSRFRNQCLNLADNMQFLQDEQGHEIGEYRFIGTNGWYSFDFERTPEDNLEYWMGYMNDYRCMGNWEDEGGKNPWPFKLAEQEANSMKQNIESALKFNKKPIIITHTLPHVDLLYQRPWDPYWQRANGFFFNSYMQKVLEEYGRNIVLWIFGHTHFRTNKVISECLCISNPRGYPGENTNWEPLVIEI